MPVKLSELQGKALLAMPQLKDPFFEQSVCYICQHDEEGALGFVINKPVDMLEQDLLRDQHLDVQLSDFQRPLLSGGPLHTDRGFVIHMNGGRWKNTMKIKKNLYVTTSQEILAAIAKHVIIENYFMVLGYAAWEPGQLETELLENDWLVSDIETDLLFKIPFEQRWERAMQRLGIQNTAHLMRVEGHA